MSSNSNPTRRARPLFPSLSIIGAWLATLAALSASCKSDAGNPGTANDHAGSGASAGAGGSGLNGDGGTSSAGSKGETGGTSGSSTAGSQAVAGSAGAAGGADLGDAGASGAADSGGTTAGGAGGAAAGGNAGVGGANGGAGGSGGPTAVGSAKLVVPFVKTAGASSTTFQIAFDRDVDLSAAVVATFDLCVESSSAPSVTIAFGAQNGAANNFSGHAGAPILLSDLTPCPTMKHIPFNVAGGALAANAVNGVAVIVGAPAIADTNPTPTVVYLDSVKFSNNAAGPYDFTYNSQPILVNSYVPHVAHSGVQFVAVGNDSPVVSPGVAKLSVPFTASGQVTTYSYLPAGAVDLSGYGVTLNANLCVAASTAAPSSYGYGLGVSSNSSVGAGEHYTGTMSLSTLSTCPTMTKTSLPIEGGSLYSPLVTNFYIQLESLGNGPFGTASIEVDSITVTPNNPVGPYDFSFNTETLQTIGMPQPGSTVTWLPLP